MSADKYTWYDKRVLPIVWEYLLHRWIPEYAICMIAYNRNMRQYLDRKRKGLSTIKNKINKSRARLAQ